MQFSPYLLFNGDCAEAFKFYEQLFGGKIEGSSTFAGSPAAEHVPPEWGDKILHAAMTIEGQVIMASDAPPGQYMKPQGLSVAIGLKDSGKGEQISTHLPKVELCRCRTKKLSGRRDSGCVSIALEYRGWSMSIKENK